MNEMKELLVFLKESEVVKRWTATMPDFFKNILRLLIGVIALGVVLLTAHEAGKVNLDAYSLFGVSLHTIIAHMESASVLSGLFIKLTAKPQVPNESLQ